MSVSAIQPDVLLENNFGTGATGSPEPRLPLFTRTLAARYLSGEFGRKLLPGPVAPETDQTGRSVLDVYCTTVRRIAENAPLLLEPGELLAGAAPYLDASLHILPGTAGDNPIQSLSHNTIGFEKALRIGYAGIRREIEERLREGGLTDFGNRYLKAMLSMLDSARVWHQRYILGLQERIATSEGLPRKRFEELLAILQRVPEQPPRTFHEAAQALWEFWEFQRLCGNWSGIGRIDKILGPFLEKDLKAGRLTLAEARDILAHFWIKGTEWTGGAGFGTGSTGDAQFYQNVILAGVDENGNEVANSVTYLVLDIVEELHISDFPIAVRVGQKTPDRLWKRIAEVQRLGGGIVSIYNDDLVVKALVGAGFPLEDARDFTNDGCWEVLIPGKSFFAYRTFDSLQLLKECLELDPAKPATTRFDSFEDVYGAFERILRRQIERISAAESVLPAAESAVISPLVDLWVEGCIQKGRPCRGGGPVYRIVSPHLGGFADMVNNLSAIRKFVFEEKRLSFDQFRDAVRSNWEGNEALRLQCYRETPFYGNDDADADAMALRFFNTYTALCRESAPAVPGLLMPPGVSTFGREIKWRNERPATFFGKKEGDILAANLSPTPGTDRKGPTAAIKSYAKFDFMKLANGSPLDLRLDPSCLKGETGLNALVSLLKTFVRLGGWYLQLDVVSADMLREAQKRPDQFPNLVVRISGWSARFSTLCKEWQDAIIERTTHGF